MWLEDKPPETSQKTLQQQRKALPLSYRILSRANVAPDSGCERFPDYKPCYDCVLAGNDKRILKFLKTVIEAKLGVKSESENESENHRGEGDDSEEESDDSGTHPALPQVGQSASKQGGYQGAGSNGSESEEEYKIDIDTSVTSHQDRYKMMLSNTFVFCCSTTLPYDEVDNSSIHLDAARMTGAYVFIVIERLLSDEKPLTEVEEEVRRNLDHRLDHYGIAQIDENLKLTGEQLDTLVNKIKSLREEPCRQKVKDYVTNVVKEPSSDMLLQTYLEIFSEYGYTRRVQKDPTFLKKRLVICNNSSAQIDVAAVDVSDVSDDSGESGETGNQRASEWLRSTVWFIHWSWFSWKERFSWKEWFSWENFVPLKPNRMLVLTYQIYQSSEPASAKITLRFRNSGSSRGRNKGNWETHPFVISPRTKDFWHITESKEGTWELWNIWNNEDKDEGSKE